MIEDTLQENPNDFTEQRPWSVKFLTFLFFGQALIFLGAGILDFRPLPSSIQSLESLRLETIPFGTLAFGALSWLALLTGFGFIRLWSTAWSNGMLVQGLSLLLALILYFREAPFYAYVLMAYGIFMTIYLYHSEVQAAFETQKGDEEL